MSPPHAHAHQQHGWTYRIFRRDIGRKVTALTFALVLFAALDRQVQDTDTFEFAVQFVDESDLETRRFSGSQLVILVGQRGTESLVVPRSRQEGVACSLRLKGKKDALARLQSEGYRLVYRLNRPDPGMKDLPVTVPIHYLDGIDGLRSSLGVGGTVEWDQPLQLFVTVEARDDLPLKAEHIRTEGEPGGGWVYEGGPNDVLFSRSHLTVIGPEEVVSTLIAERSLFAPIDLTGLTDRVERPLRLSDEAADDIELGGADDLEVTILLQRRLRKIEEKDGGLFQKRVLVYFDPTLLKREDAQFKFHAEEGLVPRILDPNDSPHHQVAIRLLAPESLFNQDECLVDPANIENASKKTVPMVSAHDADSNPQTVDLHLLKMDQFPEQLEVQLENPTAASVTVTWVEEPAADVSGSEEGQDGGD